MIEVKENFISSSKVIFEGNTPALKDPTILSYLIAGILAIGSLIFIANKDYELNKRKLIPLALFIIALLTFIEYLYHKKTSYPLSRVLLLDDHLEREIHLLREDAFQRLSDERLVVAGTDQNADGSTHGTPHPVNFRPRTRPAPPPRCRRWRRSG